MLPYVTLFGQVIRMDVKPLTVRKTAIRLIELRRFVAMTPKMFAKQARQIIRDEYPTGRLYYRAMRGTLGEVFRDCFYRLHLARFDAEQSEHVRQQLCFNPLRLLLDCYLDGDQTQKEFAEKTGINPAPLSRAFNALLHRKGEGKTGEISVERLMIAFQKLGNVPCIAKGKGEANIEPKEN